MRTVKALRKAIKANDGELVIGKLRIKSSDGDIDFHLENKLIAWINKSVNEDAKVEEIAMTVNSGVFANSDQENRLAEAEKEVEVVKNDLSNALNDIVELNKKLEEAEAKPAIKDGMIFAYEKVLKLDHTKIEDGDARGKEVPNQDESSE